jgi:hypothetical protein
MKPNPTTPPAKASTVPDKDGKGVALPRFVRLPASRENLIVMVDMLCSIIEMRVLPSINSPLHHTARWLVDDAGWKPKRQRTRLRHRKPNDQIHPRMTTIQQPTSPAPDAMPLSFWTCLLCGRKKFTRPGHPHRCGSGIRKRFKAEAKRRGLENAFIISTNDEMTSLHNERK